MAAMPRRVFLSWCRTDRAAKESLVAPLLDHLRILSGVEVLWWEDSDITLGEEWHRRIVASLEGCDYGLLLLSPAFLASGFIRAEELPWFVGPDAVKAALPVMLKRVPLDGSRQLHGVDRHQIFTDPRNGRCFTETRGAGRERFVVELASAIQRRMLGDG